MNGCIENVVNSMRMIWNFALVQYSHSTALLVVRIEGANLNLYPRVGVQGSDEKITRKILTSYY